MVTNTERLAQIVKQAMKDHNWDVADLAHNSGVTEEALYRSLTGIPDWPLTRVFKVAGALNIKASELIALAETPAEEGRVAA